MPTFLIEQYPRVEETKLQGGLCFEAEINYLCLLTDVCKLDVHELIGDQRVVRAQYTSLQNNELNFRNPIGKAIILKKEGRIQSSIKPNFYSYGANTAMIILSDYVQDIGKILASPEKSTTIMRKGILTEEDEVYQVSPRAMGRLGNIMAQNLGIRSNYYTIDTVIQKYKDQVAILANPVVELFKLDHIHREAERRSINLSSPECYSRLYRRMLAEIQSKLTSQGIWA